MESRTITTLDEDFSWSTLVPGDVVWVHKPHGYPLLVVSVQRRRTFTGLMSTYLALLTPDCMLFQIRKSATS